MRADTHDQTGDDTARKRHQHQLPDCWRRQRGHFAAGRPEIIKVAVKRGIHHHLQDASIHDLIRVQEIALRHGFISIFRVSTGVVDNFVENRHLTSGKASQQAGLHAFTDYLSQKNVLIFQWLAKTRNTVIKKNLYLRMTRGGHLCLCIITAHQ